MCVIRRAAQTPQLKSMSLLLLLLYRSFTWLVQSLLCQQKYHKHPSQLLSCLTPFLMQITPTDATADKEEIKEKKEDNHLAQEEGSSDWPCQRVCHTHERAIAIQQTVEALDITEEGTRCHGFVHRSISDQTLFFFTIQNKEKQRKKNPDNSCYGSGVETLLCYLELHPQRFVELLHPTLSVCKISCYDGPRQLRKVTKMCGSIYINTFNCSSFIIFSYTLISSIDA